MDHALTCNNLKCRKELTYRALVTTCSHIFCLDCANQYGVAGQNNQGRSPTCPACRVELAKPDDAVITNLVPTEDYKTSVLSGLSPNIIMECAGRALSFWAYQTTQDIYYQQHLYRVLSEKFSSLNLHLEKTSNEAKSDIENLQNKLTAMMSEHDALRRKNEELIHAHREKNKKLLQTQELYDKVKRKAEMTQIQRAASDAVDSSLQQASQGYSQGFDGNYHARDLEDQHSVPTFGQNHRLNSLGPPIGPVMGGMNSGIMRSKPPQLGDDNRWAGLPPRSEISATPMGGPMRQRISLSSIAGSAGFHGYGGPNAHNQNEGRRENTPSFANSRAGLSGGLTSGLKVSQPASLSGLDASQRGH